MVEKGDVYFTGHGAISIHTIQKCLCCLKSWVCYGDYDRTSAIHHTFLATSYSIRYETLKWTEMTRIPCTSKYETRQRSHFQLIIFFRTNDFTNDMQHKPIYLVSFECGSYIVTTGHTFRTFFFVCFGLVKGIFKHTRTFPSMSLVLKFDKPPWVTQKETRECHVHNSWI